MGFKDKGQKDNWKDFFDTQGLPPLATYSTWIARRTKDMNNDKKASIRLAFFYTWTETWVGKAAEHWMTAPWRAWVAAISSINPGSKQLFIWDCNAQLKAEGGRAYRNDLLGAQRSLLDVFRKSNITFSKVWLGGEGGGANETDISIKLTRDFLVTVTTEQDTAIHFCTEPGQNLHKWTQVRSRARPAIAKQDSPPRSPLPPPETERRLTRTQSQAPTGRSGNPEPRALIPERELPERPPSPAEEEPEEPLKKRKASAKDTHQRQRKAKQQKRSDIPQSP